MAMRMIEGQEVALMRLPRVRQLDKNTAYSLHLSLKRTAHHGRVSLIHLLAIWSADLGDADKDAAVG